MSTAPTPSLRERRKEATRRDLVEATLRIIQEGGLDSATVDRIAREAGMARATLYAHFPEGRDNLLAAAYAQLGVRLIETTRAAVAAATDPRDRMLAVADAMIELAGDRHLGHFYNVSGPALIPSGSARGAGSSGTQTLLLGILDEAGGSGGDPTIRAALASLLTGALRQVGQDVASGAHSADAHRQAFADLSAAALNHA